MLVQFSKVSFIYNEKKIIENLDFSMDQGKRYCILGPSGCGKTTTLHILCKLINPTEGKVILSKNLKTTLIMQENPLLPWKSVRNNILMGIKNKINNEIDDIISSLEISKFQDSYPYQISGGQKQKVALARAILSNPNLLLMDEPFSALDFINRKKIYSLIFKIQKQKLFSILMVTHSIEEAVLLSDEIIILSNPPCKILNIIKNPFCNILGENFFSKSTSFYEFCNHVQSNFTFLD